MKTTDDKKTALKLLDKYAESHKRLEEENKILRTEITDLRVNLKINKEIIQGFFQCGNSEEKSTLFLKKLKDENLNMNSIIEKLMKEKDDLREKVNL
jgi:hypothetical protein